MEEGGGCRITAAAPTNGIVADSPRAAAAADGQQMQRRWRRAIGIVVNSVLRIGYTCTYFAHCHVVSISRHFFYRRMRVTTSSSRSSNTFRWGDNVGVAAKVTAAALSNGLLLVGVVGDD